MATKTTQSLPETEPQLQLVTAAEHDPPPDDAPDHRDQIAALAYLKAERRGFEPGHELADWLDAEEELGRGG